MSQRSIGIGMEDIMNLQMNNSRGSFDHNFRGSFERGSLVENDGKINSFLGSMIQPNNGSIIEMHH
jgi:hypothetical protein